MPRLVLEELVNLGDVGVIELRDNLGLAAESGESVGVAGDRGRQRLDGDVAFEPGIPGTVDLPHAPAPRGPTIS